MVRTPWERSPWMKRKSGTGVPAGGKDSAADAGATDFLKPQVKNDEINSCDI
jgi:hypothetical protein